MEKSIDEAISHLYTYSSTMGSGQTTQAQHEDAKRVAIDTMRKYQKIQEIIKDDTYYEEYGNNAETFIVSAISEVIEDGRT